MNVVFRVDASVRIGTDHLIRCLTLAELLRKRGVQVRFISRELAGNLFPLLRQKAMPVTMLPAPTMNDTTTSEDYADSLGVTQYKDAVQTIEALLGVEPDWLVVDHFGLACEWEQRLRPHVKKLMVIDDLANRYHDCDLLLNQNYSAKGKQSYVGMVTDECMLLLGPRYALLPPEYTAYRKTQHDRDVQIRRVLVFFGDSDPKNLTGMAIQALSDPKLKHLALDVVVGANNLHCESLDKQASIRLKTRIYYGPRPHLADLMSQADLAIGTGGATTWLRMCLGLPAVVVSTTENQRADFEALAAAKLIKYAGHFDDIKVDHLISLFSGLMQGTERLAELSTKNKLQVDGLGGLRLVEVMNPTADHEIRLRPACEEDMAIYFDWKNDTEVLHYVTNTILNPWKLHQKWFASKLHDVNSCLFVLEATDLPVGQIRLDRQGDEAHIDYSFDPIVRERGWSSRLIALGADMMQQSEPLRLCSEVKAGNEVPSALFLRLGFLERHQAPGERAGRSIAILSDRTSWVGGHIRELLLEWLVYGHRVLWVHDKKQLRRGDFCFYLSCGQIVTAETLALFRHNLVVHESDLPRGRGWSPLTWQILEGINRFPVTLFEAVEKVDSGVIYLQEWLEFEGHELIEELRQMQGVKTLELCTRFLYDYSNCTPTPQSGEASFYRRRMPSDSRLDPEKTIREQFNLLRTVDNVRYPAYFELDGYCYQLNIMRRDWTP